MPKHEKGTPKEIANRSKSKGLQKLKWFCQMCQKQCRDQNGFKCHLTSEAHQRQMLLFADNQNSYLREFSREFEANFMHILRHSFGCKRVKANEVYQEYIKDKGHVHMNSTTWHTLTGFVLYLGKSGKCKVDENEKGWHIQYIDQEEEIRKQKLQQRAKQEKDDEERQQDQLQRQIERAREKLGDEDEMTARKEPQELIRNDDSKIAFSLGGKKQLIDKKPAPFLGKNAFSGSSKSSATETGADKKFKVMSKGFTAAADLAGPSTSKRSENGESDRGHLGASSSKKPTAGQKRKSALEEIMEEEEEALRRKRDLKKYWMNKRE